MALSAKYTKPLQIVATPKMREDVEEIAEREERSLADVYRELIDLGLKSRARRTGK